MEPVIALHAPAAASVAAAPSSNAAQPPTFPPAAPFTASPGVTTDKPSREPPVTEIMCPPSFHDNLKFLQIASSTDSTCSVAVSTPESKSSDGHPSPKHAEFETSACSPSRSSSAVGDRGSYHRMHHGGGRATEDEEVEFCRSTRQLRAIPAAVDFLHVPASAIGADSQKPPVAALLAAAATAAAPFRAAQPTVGEPTLAREGSQPAELTVKAAAAAPTHRGEAAGSSTAEITQPSGKYDVDVAIIGAGLAGLTAALAIHKKTGREVHVFEKEAWCGGELSLLRVGERTGAIKSRQNKALHEAAGQGLPPTEKVTRLEGLHKEATGSSTLGGRTVGESVKESADREVLLQANGLDALRCIDEELACDVLESGHIVYSDSLDVFDWEAEATGFATLIFGIYWSELRRILYKHCQRYPNGIIFNFGRYLTVAVGEGYMPSTAESPTMKASTMSPPSPPTATTSLASPLSSSTISTPSSCSAYSSSVSSSPIGRNSTQFNPIKDQSLGQQQDDRYAEAVLSHSATTAKSAGEDMPSFCTAASDDSPGALIGVRLCFHDGVQVNAKLAVGADGPASCARKTFTMKPTVANKMEQHQQYGNSPSSTQWSKIQYQGLTELALGEEKLPHTIWLYHKKSGHHISMIKALGPNVLTWTLTKHMDQAAPDPAAVKETDWKDYVLETISHMKQETSEKTREAFDLLHRLIARTTQEDVQRFPLSRPAYQSCRWTRLSDRLVLVGNAAHPTPPNLGQSHDLTIEDTVQLAYCLRDWNTNDVLAAQRFASIRQQSLSPIAKLSEAVFKAVWSEDDEWKHCDGELHEVKVDADNGTLLYPRPTFVPVRSYFGADESQALLENAELETEYM